MIISSLSQSMGSLWASVEHTPPTPTPTGKEPLLRGLQKPQAVKKAGRVILSVMSFCSLAHNHWRSWRLPACYHIIWTLISVVWLCSLYVVARYTWPAASSFLAEFASAACGRQVGFALLFPKVQDCDQFHGVAVCSFNLRVVAH